METWDALHLRYHSERRLRPVLNLLFGKGNRGGYGDNHDLRNRNADLSVRDQSMFADVRLQRLTPVLQSSRRGVLLASGQPERQRQEDKLTVLRAMRLDIDYNDTLSSDCESKGYRPS